MLRELLKQEIDRLSESQLRRTADFVTSIKVQAQQAKEDIPFWQRSTPAERSQNFRMWVSRLPKSSASLPDEAFDRGGLYE